MTNMNIDPWQMRHPTDLLFLLSRLVRFALIVLGLPYLLFMAITTSMMSSYYNDNSGMTLSYICWLGFAVILTPFAFANIRRRYRLRKILSALKNEEEFNPGSGNEIFEFGHHAYLGLDIHRGTMLFIRFVEKNRVDIMGFTMSNWKDGSLTRSTLTINTRYVDCPWIDISSNKANRLFDKLSVMRERHYDYPDNWPGYVRSAGQNIAKELGLTFIPY